MAYDIIYNGSVIATDAEKKRTIIACSGQKMLSDIIVIDDRVPWAYFVTSDGYVIIDSNGTEITTFG